MVLNPAYRMSWIKKHWSCEGSDKAIQVIKSKMHDSTPHSRGQECRAKSPVKVVARAHKPLSLFETIREEYGLEDDMLVCNLHGGEDKTVDQEFDIYFNRMTSPMGTDILQFWLTNEFTFPILFSIAIDYLPIQASAVPSECIFSSSGETDTNKCNCINPALMEALQMLKFFYKKSRLNFTEGLVLDEQAFEEADTDMDLLSVLMEAQGKDSVKKLDNLFRLLAKDDEDDALAQNVIESSEGSNPENDC